MLAEESQSGIQKEVSKVFKSCFRFAHFIKLLNVQLKNYEIKHQKYGK